MERAFDLRTELENAASDVSNLFAKIGLYAKLSDLNRIRMYYAQNHAV